MKERTLQGVHQGERLFMGIIDSLPVEAVIWDGMLLLSRNKLPHSLVKQWRGRYVVGGRFWLPVPHPFVKNPLNLILFPDTLTDALTKPIRRFLIPGYTSRWFFWRWLHRRVQRRFADA